MTILVSLAMILLSGCGQAVSSPDLEVYCPTPPAYSYRLNQQLADELEALPPSSTVIPQVIGDYVKLRDELLYCRSIASGSN